MTFTLGAGLLWQIVMGAFTAGGLYMWLKSNMATSRQNDEEQDKQLERFREECEKLKDRITHLEHVTMTREDSFKAFVTKEMLEKDLRGIHEKMDRVLKVLEERIT